MNDHAIIIDAFGGGAACARALKAVNEIVDRDTVHAWKARKRIPDRYWPAFMKAAERADLTGLTLLVLAGMSPVPKELVDAAARAPRRGRA